jgi:hypothetical protein
MWDTWSRFRRATHQVSAEREIKEAEVEALVAQRQALERRKVVEARLDDARQRLATVEEPEPEHLTRPVRGLALTVLVVAAIALTTWGNYWALEAWVHTATWKRFLFASTFAVLALIGGVALGAACRKVPEAKGRKLEFGVGCALLTLAILFSLALSIYRGIDLAWLEQRAQRADELSDDLTGTRPSPPVNNNNRLMTALITVASAAAAVGGEIGSAYAVDQFLLLLGPVWRLSRLRRRVRRYEDELVELAVIEETAIHQPSLVRVQITTELVEIEQARTAEAGRVQQALAERAQARQILPLAEDHRLAPVAWKVILVIVAVALVIALLVHRAQGAELESTHTVVELDLTQSTNAGEFQRNVEAVDGTIRRLDGPRPRFAVLAVTRASFQEPAIIDETGPREPGRYGERLDGWKQRLLARWRDIAKSLRPSSRGSDFFGAIARTAVEFRNSDAGKKELIILADMRQVGRGMSFELVPIREPKRLVGAVAQQGLIPRLDGVKIWVLGVHTSGFDELRWHNLREFWEEYFRRTGAHLQAFTPGRRFVNR